MKSFFHLATLLVLSDSGFAAERHYDMRIRPAADGRPCFAVEDNAETRKSAPRVAVVDLYERREGKAVLVWEAGFMPGQGGLEKRLPVGDCIAYAAGEASDAPMLAAGKPYRATIWAFVDLDGESHRRWYTGDFCMIETDDGLRVHQVRRDVQGDAAGWRVCGAGVHW